MPKRKRKVQQENPFGVLLDFANTVDALFVKFTGKPIQVWLAESSQSPRELPPGGKTAVAEPRLPLADAYAILGLKPDAPLTDVKKHYRNLAMLFHTDRGGMNDEAMKLINRAYEAITKRGG